MDKEPLASGNGSLASAGQQSTPTETPKVDVLKPYLDEYTSLRNEVFARLGTQQHAFNVLLALLAAAVSATGYLINSGRFDELAPQLILFLPMLVAPLGFIFFDNEFMLFTNGRYIATHIQKNVARLTGENNALLLEETRFTYLSPIGCRMHFLLSVSRWFLFLVPVLGPIWYSWTYTSVWRQEFYLILFAFDCIMAVFLLAAVASGIYEQTQWRAQER